MGHTYLLYSSLHTILLNINLVSAFAEMFEITIWFLFQIHIWWNLEIWTSFSSENFAKSEWFWLLILHLDFSLKLCTATCISMTNLLHDEYALCSHIVFFWTKGSHIVFGLNISIYLSTSYMCMDLVRKLSLEIQLTKMPLFSVSCICIY